MKGALIFIGGVITGAAVTLGAIAVIENRNRKKYKNYDLNEDDLYERYKGWEKFEPDVPEESNKENVDMMSEKETKEAEEYNRMTAEYVEKNKEVVRVLEPVLLSREDFENSPFQHNYYQWFTKDQLLVDDELCVVTDNRCGREFIEVVERDGIAWVTNDEIEEVFEIERFDDCSIDDLDDTPFE